VRAPRASQIAPGFLVAVPTLGDPNFNRAVVLMLEHSDAGALGIVINRPGNMKMSDVARTQGVKPRAWLAGSTVFMGGPVQPERGFLLHDRDDLGESVRILDGLYVSSSSDSLRELLTTTPNGYRLCLGYAGWGPGQLERELREGAWVHTEAVPHHVLETPAKEAWETVLREMGIEPMTLLRGGGLPN